MYKGDFFDGTCISVYGIFNNKEYAIEFVPWGEWMTMNIEQQTLNDFTAEEIIAACLYEMTYNGYTENDVMEKCKDLEDTIISLNKND